MKSIRSGVLVLAVVLPLGVGCPTVDQGDVPVAPEPCRPAFLAFKDTIWPMALAPADANASCVSRTGCHARESGRSALRLIPMPMNDMDYMANYEVVTRFLNCSSPDSSPLITKPGGGADPHGGGDLWTAGTPPADTVEQWISGEL
jgi:hypothetical protein